VVRWSSSTMSPRGLAGEMRSAVRSAPMASATARVVSATRRTRLAGEPPHSSWRLFDPVEARLDGVAGGGGEVGDGLPDFRGGQRDRLDEVLEPLGGEDLAGGPDGRGTDRGGGLGVVGGVAYPAGVHELGEDDAAPGVDGVGHLPPGLHLGRAVQPRGVGVSLADGRGLDALGDDEARAGSLGVVLRHQWRRAGAGAVGTATGHGRHDDPVLQCVTADLDGGERADHVPHHSLRLK
jgi:hypothetical protein